MGGCAGEVGTAVAASCKDSLVGTESVKGAVLLVVGGDTDTLSLVLLSR